MTLQRHFGLRLEPFGLTPDPAFLYMSEGHAEALAGLKLGLLGRRGLVVLVGEVGTGKTTLLYSLLGGLGQEIHTAYVANTAVPFDDILRAALRDFGVPPPADGGRFALLEAMNGLLRRCAGAGTMAAMIIDEAQNLADEAFEGLRLLLNFETYREKLLQIVLVGQPELDSRLRQPSLRQVADRIAIRCHLNPLSPAESRQYVDHRLRAAGSSSAIFTPAALELAIARSRGIPRRINVLCHNALLFAYGRDLARVDRGVMAQAVREQEGRGLVRLPAGRPPRLGRGLRWLLAAGGTAGAVLLLLAAGALQPRTAAAPTAAALPAAVRTAAALSNPPAPPAPPAPAAPAPLPAVAPGGADGAHTVAVEPGQTLYSLMLELYGRYDQRLLDQVLAANPQIADADVIVRGDRLRFPKPAGDPSLAEARRP